MTCLDSAARTRSVGCMVSEGWATCMSAITTEEINHGVCCAVGSAVNDSAKARVRRCSGRSCRWRNACRFLSTWPRDAGFDKPPA